MASATVEDAPMFTKSAHLYDAIYEERFDFANAANQLHDLIQQHSGASATSLLDVACGTGIYLTHLRHHYEVEGLDLDPNMVALARERLPAIPLHQADLIDFDLGRQFDAVVCLGSSIGYARTLARLRQAVATMARHTSPGGVVVVEPWFSPESWDAGCLSADLVDRPDLKIARVLSSGRDRDVSILEIHYLVGTPEGVESFSERHELWLFRQSDYLEAFEAAGLAVTHDPEGLIKRGLYIGRR